MNTFQLTVSSTHHALFSLFRVVVGQSDWSEIDNTFSSDDDDELFSYFETNSASNFKPNIRDEDLSNSERSVCASFDIRKGQFQHSADQSSGHPSRAKKLLPKKISAFSPFISDQGVQAALTE